MTKIKKILTSKNVLNMSKAKMSKISKMVLHIFKNMSQCSPGWPLEFYQIWTTKENPEYRPNIDHAAFYRPNIDRKS